MAHISRRDALKCATARPVGALGVDVNNICKPQFGQWA
jgi:hypothetical protein